MGARPVTGLPSMGRTTTRSVARAPVPLLLLLAALLPASVSGQDTASAAPSPGSRLRVTMEGRDVATGGLAYLRSDTLGLRVSGLKLVRPLPLDSVARVEISAGRRSHLVLYTIIGSALGGGAGLVVGVTSDGGDLTDRAITRGGLFGGAVGFVAGLASSSEVWKPVPLEVLRTGGLVSSPSQGEAARGGAAIVLWRLPL